MPRCSGRPLGADAFDQAGLHKRAQEIDRDLQGEVMTS
jgi:hypothetical protein